MVNAQDFTYSKGYLGLLSMLGASLGIIFCCAPAVVAIYRMWREASPRGASTAGLIDEENASTDSETRDENSLAMTEDRPNQTHGRRKDGYRCNLLQRHRRTKAFPENVLGADHIDVETPVAISESSDMSLPTTENNVTKTYYRSTVYQKLETLLERVPRAAHIDEGNPATAAENPDEILLPTTESNADQICGRSARCSMDGCVAGFKRPLYGKLQRHRTF